MIDKKDSDDSGYSEKKVDANIELQAGQWLDLNSKQQKKPQALAQIKSTIASKPTRQMLLDYQQQVWEKLSKKIEEYRDALTEDKDVSELLLEISGLQTSLGNVLKSLKWEQKGDLDRAKLPKEIQDLLK